MTLRRWTIAAVALVVACLAIWRLEAPRAELSITPMAVGATPATVYRQPGAAAPLIMIAHGFAGSRQMMESFALQLARAGYIAVTFDFEGHGRNPTPMSGDVTRIDGTTARLVEELSRVIDAGLALPGVDGRVGLLGHSMASDIVVRQAVADPRIGATVAISMYSEAATRTGPDNLLMVTGAWERFLRAEALRVLQMVDPSAGEGETVEAAVTRRAAVAPFVEHVGVLYSRVAVTEARDWFNRAFGMRATPPPVARGPALVALFAAILVLGWALSALLPQEASRPAPISRRGFVLAITAPALATPVLLAPFELRFLPVLIADYLALHLLLIGLIQGGILVLLGVRPGRLHPIGLVCLVFYGLAVFGLALDRYGANFMPGPGRLPIIAALALGAVPFMLADALVTEGARAARRRRVAARAAFLLSLALAVALNFERLFFLVIILPVIVLYFLVFGSMGGWVARRQGGLASGLGLGVILAWSLGVSFPMFIAP